MERAAPNWVIAASGVLLRFSVDLPVTSEMLESAGLTCYTCKLLKIILIATAAIAVAISTWGLLSKPKGKVPEPKKLMESELYSLDSERLKCHIINSWIETNKEYLEFGMQKGKRLNMAIRLLCIAIVAFAIDILLITILN